MHALRKRAGLTVAEASVLMEISPSTVSRIENGDDRAKFRSALVRHWMTVLHATEDEAALLVEMTSQTNNLNGRGAWWHDPGLSKDFSLFVRLEVEAATFREYEPELVPGLLQTRAYAEAVFRSGQPEEEVQRRTGIRVKRQALLTAEQRPELDMILNEAVLRRPVGGPKVMAEQLGHLLKVMDEGVASVRVLPFVAGAYTGMGSAFTLLLFPTSASEPPLVYVDTYTESMGSNEATTIGSYRAAWDELDAKALNRSQSREMIYQAMREFMHG